MDSLKQTQARRISLLSLLGRFFDLTSARARPLRGASARSGLFGPVRSGAAPGRAETPKGAHRTGGRPLGQRGLAEPGVDQTWPALSSAVQQVSTISRVTTYGSTLAFGRRSSM